MNKQAKVAKLLIVLIIITFITVIALVKKEEISLLFQKLKLKKIPLIEKLTKPKERVEEAEEEAIPEEEILIKAYRVAKRSFEDTLPTLGTVKGFREIDLKFEISGIIDSLNFREGEEIREGDIIATLNQKDALLKLKYNELEVNKYKQLYEIGSITKLRLEQAQLEYESAENDLEKTYLYAPRDGMLGTRDAEVGEYVSPNDKIGTLIDSLDVFIEVGIIEKDIGKARVGDEAKIFVDTYPDKEFMGIVDNVSPVIEGKSRTQTIKIRVKNDEKFLLPGMFTRALIASYSTDDAIIVPSLAINKTEEGYIVFVVHEAEEEEETETEEDFEDEDVERGTVEARPIEIEYRSSDYTVLRRGLEEDELVVVETQEKLKDQAPIIIAEIQEQLF